MKGKTKDKTKLIEKIRNIFKSDIKITFNIMNKDNKTEDVQMSIDELRNKLSDANPANDNEMISVFVMNTEDDKAEIQVSAGDLKKIILRAEYCKDVIPKKIREYLIDLTQAYAKLQTVPIVGRDEEIEKCWFYLSQRKRNTVFLIGDVEVGKSTIALELARQIATFECPKEFEGKRAFVLQEELLLKITSNWYYKYIIGKIEDFLLDNNGDYILYIDKGIYMKTDEKLIYMLQDFMRTHNIPIISTLSIEDYNEYFLEDPSISKYLNYVYVEEPELEDIMPMITNYVNKLSDEYQIKISDRMVQFAILTSLLDESVSCNPGKSINVLEKAFLEAKRKGKNRVDKECILSCYNSYLKLYKKMDPEEKKIIAYHETGHYVVTMFCNEVLKDEKIAFVSILPMMDFYGVNWRYTLDGKNLNYTDENFIERIAICLGGRISEKKVTSNNSSGAFSDLTHASDLAERMITQYALLEENKNRSYLTDDSKLKSYLVSNEKKAEWDEQVQNVIDIAYKRAEDIINTHWELVEMITKKLLQDEIVVGNDLKKIVDNYLKGIEKTE